MNLENINFIKSANQVSQFPEDSGREIAFVGRSNAGKSTALNAIFRRKNIAKTSKTPGRTQLVNFFLLMMIAELLTFQVMALLLSLRRNENNGMN